MFSHVCWHRRPGETQHSFTSARETVNSRHRVGSQQGSGPEAETPKVKCAEAQEDKVVREPEHRI